MKFRKVLVAALCVASIGAFTLPETASAAVEIYFNAAPPPLRYEPVPVARKGYTWAPGYWNARGEKHVWQAGHWEKNRQGYYYAQPTWTQRERWQLEPARWNKGDRDHDGVPNSMDRAPDNPNRR
jgi:hypothetical protein